MSLAAGALSWAHRNGVVHRDLKPGNVMLTASGVKLLDFGLARSMAGESSGATPDSTAEQLTATGVIPGTLRYMAPEQLHGKPADARSDVFALGTTLYEMATGKRAFSGGGAALVSQILGGEPVPILSLRPELPRALDVLVRSGLIKDPERRWQSAHDAALQLASMALPGSADEVARAAPSSRRGAAAWGVAATAALVAIAALWTRAPSSAPAAVLRCWRETSARTR